MTAKDIESVMKNAQTSINHRQSASGSLHVPNGRLNRNLFFNLKKRISSSSLCVEMNEQSARIIQRTTATLERINND